MNPFDLSTLTFSQVNIFLAAAKTLSFSAAAEKLHITQPLVSRTISNLEEQFGFPLFHRRSRHVELTLPGSLLLEKWDALYASALDSVESVRSVYEKEMRTLNVADDYMQTNAAYVSPIIDRFKAENPSARLHIEQLLLADLIRSVLEGSADIGFIFESEISRIKDGPFTFRKIGESTFFAIVGHDHSFAGRHSVTLGELKDTPLVVINKNNSVTYYETIMTLFSANSLVPKIASYVTSTPSLLNACQHDGLAAVAHGFITPLPFVEYIPIENTSCSLYLFWKKDNQKTLLHSFVEIAGSVFRQLHT